MDNADVLAAIDVPTLLVHGTSDEVVHPSTTEYAAKLVPNAETHWYQEIGTCRSSNEPSDSTPTSPPS